MNSKWLIIGAAVIALLAIAYFAFMQPPAEAPTNGNDSMMEQSESDSMMEEEGTGDSMMEEETMVEDDAMMEEESSDSMMEEQTNY